jgi:pimeloyl-ACP methyl ester carboxylesterase
VGPLLAERGRVAAMDLPGHGASPAQDFSGNMSDYAAVVRDVIAQLDLRELTVVGHSMGAQIAMTLALETRARIERLVLVAPAGIETFSEAEAAKIRGLQTPELLRQFSRDTLLRVMRALFFSEPADLAAQVEARVQRMASSDGESYALTLSRSVDGMLGGRVYERLSSLRVPVLVLFGADDLAIPNRLVHVGTSAEVAEKAQQALPKAQVIMIPRTGHMVPLEAPEAVSREILRFVMTDRPAQ